MHETKQEVNAPTYQDGNLLAGLVPDLACEAPIYKAVDTLVNALKECLATATGDRGASFCTEERRLDYIRVVAKNALKDTDNQ